MTVADELKVPAGSPKGPRQLFVDALRADVSAKISLVGVVLIFAAALATPILTTDGALEPYTNNFDLLDSERGSVPKGWGGGISWEHPLGVEPGSGADLLSRLLLGLTADFGIAAFAAFLTVALGTTLGCLAGYFGGPIDFIISRGTDLILTFPQLLMLLALTPVFVGQPIENRRVVVYVVCVLAFFGCPYCARLVRGEVVVLRNREFITAARASGHRPRTILLREVVPNVVPQLIVYATMLIPTYVSSVAVLAFLGLGLQAPFPTLGGMLYESIGYSYSDLAYFLIPGITLLIVVITFNVAGDAIRDALDPKRAHL